MPPKRASGRKRQAKLAFSPVPATSTAAASLSPQVRDRAAVVALAGSSTRSSKRRKVLQPSDDESENGLPTPKKSFSKTMTPDKREIRRNKRVGNPVHVIKKGMYVTSDTSSGEEQELSTSKKQTNTTKRSDFFMEDASSESEEDIPITPKRMSRSEKRKRRSSTPPEIASDDDDSDEVITPRRIPRPQPTSTPKRAGRSEKSKGKTPIIEIQSDKDESEEEIVPRSTRSTRRRPQTKEDTESEEDSEEEDAVGSAVTPGSNHGRTEKEELAEDLVFLQSSPPAKSDPRRTPKALNARQKALLAIKRKRAISSSAAAPSPSAATPRRRRLIVDSDSDASLDAIEEETEGEDDEEHSPNEEDDESDEIEEVDDEEKPRRRAGNASDMFIENDEDAGFLDDDPDALLGEPSDLTAIPIEFTAMSRAKPRQLFKYAVEWMVQKKINPAFAAKDEIYQLTFKKLDDEVNGLANSKYSSAAWTPEFTRVLRARPISNFYEIGKNMRSLDAHCEACNRRTHPASWSVSFTGKPYDKDTLEPLESSSSSSSSDSSISGSDDEDEDSNNGSTYDAQGERLPPESKVFSLGSTCKANAHMAHTLNHWRWHLNTWVVDYLTRMGHCTPEKLVKRDKRSQKKRRKEANKIVDDMETSGEIRKLHKLYKDQVDYALEADNEYKRFGR